MGLTCPICLREGVELKCHYKWPDAGIGGLDIEGFCCRRCDELSGEQQISKYYASREALKRLREDFLRAFIKQACTGYPETFKQYAINKILESNFDDKTPTSEIAVFLSGLYKNYYGGSNETTLH